MSGGSPICMGPDRPADPYEEGHVAYVTGAPASSNPYPAGCSAHDDWSDGWNDACEWST